MRALPAKFWAKVAKTEGGCWLWTAAKTHGYGAFWHLGKTHRVHRLSFAALVGPIPDGLCVLHRCDVPACVNPAHLFTGTHQDNMDDKRMKGRQVRGEACKNAKLSEGDVREIRRALADGCAMGDVALSFGVKRTTVRAVREERSWAHVSPIA